MFDLENDYDEGVYTEHWVTPFEVSKIIPYFLSVYAGYSCDMDLTDPGNWDAEVLDYCMQIFFYGSYTFS